MPFYADDVLGKTLKANRDVDVYRGSQTGANGSPFAEVKRGYPVGVVRGWIGTPGTDSHWWEFDDPQNSTYYVKHIQGVFDVKDLREQGLLTVKEIADAETEANLTPWERGEGLVKYGITALVLGGIAKLVLGKIIK